MMRTVAVIPARMGSSRYPGKPLVKICGLSMIEHVRRRVLLSTAVDEVIVATCDQSILEEVQRYGGLAVMTADTHERCTDRVQEAMQSVQADIVVIVQGDEPLIIPDVLDRLVKPLQLDLNLDCTNLVSVIETVDDKNDVDIVKAVLDPQGKVLYYSRAAVPFERVQSGIVSYRQTGLSAFRSTFLTEFSNLTPTPLEIAESVDFMRIIEHRRSIYAVTQTQSTYGVDRPDDVAVIESLLSEDPLQKSIFQQITNQISV